MYQAKPDNVSYENFHMVNSNKHFEPVMLYLAAKQSFYQARRKHDKSVCQWSARIKNLATKCGFSSKGLSIVNPDFFVVGMGARPIQDCF